MRLRQANAILEAAQAVDRLGLGFDLDPFDFDDPRLAVQAHQDDFLTGSAEIDAESADCRRYRLDLVPGPAKFSVTVRLRREEPTESTLLEAAFQIWHHEGEDDHDGFPTGGFGDHVARLVAESIGKDGRR
ncbi:hypothetical protein [Streptacidiphilus sp. EB103A]|uniref:hypothetical protein n=1 Tax=Streptacidiphilus sp. EB103A TaxID=3156275 RepID=UPI00351863B8